MGKTLFVGNLPFSMTSSDLQALIASHGYPVEMAQVIMERETGRSRGFGFVDMANDNDAQLVINALNGKEHDGRVLTVNVSHPRPPRTRHANDRNPYGRGRRY